MRALPEAPALESPRYDPWLLVAVLGLTTLGLVMVYSASAVMAARDFGSPWHFALRQAVAAALGLCAMVFAMRYGYRRLEKLAYPILAVAAILLLLVLVPGIGTAVNGARRWIRFPLFNVQPAEIAKYALVIYLARSLARKGEKVRSFSIGFLPHVLVTGVFVLLLLAQPDFGSGMTLLALLWGMLFCAGVRLRVLAGAALAGLPVVAMLVLGEEYRRARLVAFLDPWADRLGDGWQLANSLLTIGNGGLWGQGLGAGKQKLHYLPEGHTDFIISVIAEELGLVGIVVVVGLFGLLVWRGIRAAFNASDAFGCFLALGLTAILGIQAVVNMLVAMGMLPTKGLTLPFVSYGGSSLVLSLGAAGVLLAISSGSGGFLRPARKVRSRMAAPEGRLPTGASLSAPRRADELLLGGEGSVRRVCNGRPPEFVDA